jgi:alkylhydroperoxidase family enzyme
MASQEGNYTYCINWNTQLLTSVLGLSKEQVAAATKNPREAALTPEEKALLLFVQKVVRDPALTSQEDADHLKALGWSDQEIFDATFMGVHGHDVQSL